MISDQKFLLFYSVSQSVSSVAHSCPTLCNPMDCSTAVLPVHHQLPEFTQTHVHWVGDAIQPSHPLLSPSPPAFNHSQHEGLSSDSVLHIRWPKYWSFNFSISPSNEYSGLISFRMDWLALLSAQGTLKSLLQHHSSKASILQCSAFIIVHLSYPYMTAGETIALTRWTFVGKVMFLLFNLLSRLVIAFLPRNKCLLIILLLFYYLNNSLFKILKMFGSKHCCIIASNDTSKFNMMIITIVRVVPINV